MAKKESGAEVKVKSSDPVFLSELHEQDAPADIRAIYGEIRRLTGVPMVALIWRHLATIPGALPNAWSSVAPVLRSGLLQETAWRITVDARLPALQPPTRPRLSRMGIDDAARDAVVTVLDAYNRANPVNMLCVNVLLARLMRPDGQALAPDVFLWDVPSPIGALPRMIAPAEMPRELRATLEGLSGLEPGTGAPTIPSLYRHLVPWPGFIDWLAAALRPCISDGSVGRAVVAIQNRMSREAEALVVHVPPALALQAHPEAKTALTRFSSLIPEMIVIGRMLRETMPASD